MSFGVHHLELYVPNAYVDQEDLERADECVGKYTKGLGQRELGVCDAREDAQSMALTAVHRLLRRTATPAERIGRVDVGTESLEDASKSCKTILMDLFEPYTNIEGATHLNACYGGTAALFAALAWMQSDAWDGRWAVVVATDVARYAAGSSRATSGAGAVALLLGPDAPLTLDPLRATASRNVHDFCKPEGLHGFPVVDGALSQECYREAFRACWDRMRVKDPALALESFAAIVCHAPYCKLVRKTLTDEPLLARAEAALQLPQRCGNLYTASVYAGLLSALVYGSPSMGQRVLCYSYGSGYVASMFSWTVRGPLPHVCRADVEAMLDRRTRLGVDELHLTMDVPGFETGHPMADGDVFVRDRLVTAHKAYVPSAQAHVPPAGKLSAELDVHVRRRALAVPAALPWRGVDYEAVVGRCAENVVGFVPLPLGVAGPLRLNGSLHRIPMATTEGCLVASTNRGCKALTAGAADGVRAHVLRRHMTRAPVLRCADLAQAVAVRAYAVASTTGGAALAAAVASTSRYTRLAGVDASVVGSLLYLRLRCECGDAMGMNMTSKAAQAVVAHLVAQFPGVRCVSVSGNLCCDKKPAAVNWTHGRGCEVVCEAAVTRQAVAEVLKTTPEALVEVHTCKNLLGSALAGAMGGSNAQAANVVAAVFLATGQDAAQVGTSAQCLTHLRVDDDRGGALVASVTMPCVEVGVVGGGTHLAAQRACTHDVAQVRSAPDLAMLIGGAVLAAELSLLAALATDTLVQAHLRMNRP